MKKAILSMLVRLGCGTAIIWGFVFLETGPWTASVITALMLAQELHGIALASGDQRV